MAPGGGAPFLAIGGVLPRSSWLPTHSRYSASSATATATEFTDKSRVDTRAIIWATHMASNMSPTARPRTAYSESRIS